MFRGATARTVLSLLAAALLTVQFFAPAATFAAAHTPSHVEAKAQPGPKLSAKAVRAGSHTLQEHGLCGEPPGPPQTADRHRAATAGWTDDRPSTARHSEAIRTPVPPTARHLRTPRASRAHSPAALQVFRC
ncbi:MAG: hypothetical protein JF597_13570 [Streptomyces sp.]|uniref:hypothetical protein n=1 Tax=Streptomyces sp. TaxID=1931 RepID=UPI0025FE5D97|nr:hypothetical protein [Streptomyces sp.]MBW8794585.1 hypothetical protein [Streptomyces sp.]